MFFRAIFGVFGLLLIAGTVHHYFGKTKGQSKLVKFMMGFSIVQNYRGLLKMSTPSKGQIQCLHGIRVISMSWVVLCHTYNLIRRLPYTNGVNIGMELVQPPAMRVILNGYPSVDSFFVLGGFLLGYLTCKEMDKKEGNINWVMFYVHRYLRLA